MLFFVFVSGRLVILMPVKIFLDSHHFLIFVRYNCN
ncbi:hypothetical protein J2T14_003258 [Paenibacillus harenae]|nr:hypothetical protein [Paenibacillus harenae]